MSIIVNIGTIVVGIILILYIIKSMVDKKMTESQSILWLVIGGSAIIIGSFPSIITYIANLLGIWYAPSIIFLVVFIGLLFIVLKNTMIISVQSKQISELFMQIALLNMENEKINEQLKKIDEEVDSH